MIYGHFPKRYSKNKKTKWTFECRWHVFSFSFSSRDPIRLYQTPDSGKRHFATFFHVFGIKGHVSWKFGAFWWFGGSKKQTDFKILGISYFCLLTLQHYFLLRFIVFLRILAAARLRELDWEVYLWSSWWQRPVHRFPVKNPVKMPNMEMRFLRFSGWDFFRQSLLSLSSFFSGWLSSLQAACWMPTSDTVQDGCVSTGHQPQNTLDREESRRKEMEFEVLGFVEATHIIEYIHWRSLKW